ncbi:MAG: LysM peptidoglycan-binding domain-containing protein [Anaerolineae bacterium]|nr:LysM peptidoglycan-binding domain-containing protein [Anaerolineae bacterium]
MDDPRYDPEYEYDDYEDYGQSGVTNVGLPASQLALIIGVNAVISLVISISVVLLANRQALPGDMAALPGATDESGAEAQTDALPPAEAGVEAEASAESTPIQSVTYLVAAGDTLSGIAQKFAVSVSDLMLANGLTNQDFIQVGQELIIPVGGLATPTPTFTPVPLPTDTPLPFDPPTPLPTDAQVPLEPAATVGPSPTPSHTPTRTPTPIPTSTPAPFGEINVVINEVIGPGDFTRETLVILNKGAGASLADWKLEGSSLGIFVFPDIFLFSGGSIRIHTRAGENTASDLYLNQGESAWPPGATIFLRDNQGVEVSRFSVPSAEATPSAESFSSPTATP